MTEESTPYKTNNSQPGTRERVVNSGYFQAVKDVACSLALGYESFTTEEELCERAIALTDILIERTGEKL